MLDGVLAPSPEVLSRMHHEVCRSERLVDDLHEVSRVEAGQVSLRLAPTPLSDVVEAVLGRLGDQFRDKGISVCVELPQHLPKVRADPDRLAQVFTNLLGNALQYTPTGGRVSVRAQPGSGLPSPRRWWSCTAAASRQKARARGAVAPSPSPCPWRSSSRNLHLQFRVFSRTARRMPSDRDGVGGVILVIGGHSGPGDGVLAVPAGGENRARAILRERLARGEIVPSEYREKVNALSPSQRQARGFAPVAVLVLLAVVLLFLLTANPGRMGMPGWRMPGMGGMPHMRGWRGPSATPPASRPGARVVAVTLVDFAFQPPNLRVRATEAVNLELVNSGRVPHDLYVPDLNFRVFLQPGQQVVAGLPRVAPGTYEFYCTLPGHRSAGMEGTLTALP